MKNVCKLLSSAVLAGSLMMMSGCYTAPVMPPGGLIYSNVQAPIDTNAESTVIGPKTGESSSASILWLFAWGDASVATAADNAGISTIEHVDYEFFHILGIYQKFTTRVNGE